MNVSKGQVFSHLTTISRVSGRHQQHAKWLCKCICGNAVSVRTYYLVSKRKTHCGCLTEVHRFHKKPYYHLYTTLKRMARHREKKCDLTFEEFLTFTEQPKCCYCGESVVWNKHSKDGISGPYNLDRIDSSKGYSTTNCVVCCGLCNYTKSDTFTYDEMLRLGRTISEIKRDRLDKI